MAVFDNKISRVTRSKDDARVFYSRISRLYDFSEGSFERKYIQMGLERLSVKKDDVVFIPEGIPHSYKVISDEPFEFLCLIPNKVDEIKLIS